MGHIPINTTKHAINNDTTWSQKQTKTIAQRIERNQGRKNPYLLGRNPRSIYRLYFLVCYVSTIGTPFSFSPSFSLPFFSFISFLSFPVFFLFLFLLAAPYFYKQLPHNIYSLLHVPCMLTHGMPCVLHAQAFSMHYDTHMVHHVSLDTYCLEKRKIPIISEYNEIRLGN